MVKSGSAIMAFKKDITDERFGTLVSGAYIKLAHFRWSDADQRAVATFSVFATKEAQESGKEVVSNIEIDVTLDFSDLQQRLYMLAKTKSEFEGAIDI